MPALNWLGKDKILSHHLDVPLRSLKMVSSFGDPEAAAKNSVIHGDNLLALKALLPEYEGRIKCIYIDPPYNTGNEAWTYNDNVSDPRLMRWLGNVVGREGEDLTRHDKWLCMMYPRLKLLRQLLSDDGSIWISIDDNELASLKAVMDEIFGGMNFIANVIWQKVFSPKNSAMFFSEDHDYVLVYSKNKNVWRPNLLPRSESQDERYSNPDNDSRGAWTSGDLSARNFYSLGTYSIECPGGRVIAGPPKGMYWRFSKENFLDLVRDNRIWWGKEANGTPRLKRFLSEVKQGLVPQTIWSYTEVGHTQDAKKELLSILDFNASGDVFVTPKPTRLIERILQIATDKDSIVLDSFAGSGTTAHAVLKQNQADGGRRSFILVEMEDYADQLTSERIRRVIAGKGSGQQLGAGLAGGFGFLELGPVLFTDEGSLNWEVGWKTIASYVWHAETGLSLSSEERASDRCYLGTHLGVAYYLFAEEGKTTMLDYPCLQSIRRSNDAYVIYADSCALSFEYLFRHSITFRKIPRDIPRI
jgi:adenine-specific DNA-methyltransferase